MYACIQYTTHLLPNGCTEPGPGLSPDCPPSPDNHQFMNADGSYNVTKERKAVERAGMAFFHLPVGSTSWTKATFNAYSPTLDQAAMAGPVLTHCKSGYRSAAFVAAKIALDNAAEQDGSGQGCGYAAIQHAKMIGYSFDVAPDTAAMDMIRDVLPC